MIFSFLRQLRYIKIPGLLWVKTENWTDSLRKETLFAKNCHYSASVVWWEPTLLCNVNQCWSIKRRLYFKELKISLSVCVAYSYMCDKRKYGTCAIFSPILSESHLNPASQERQPHCGAARGSLPTPFRIDAALGYRDVLIWWQQFW